MGPKNIIAYYEAKWYFKVPKFLSWVFKLVCYMNKSIRSLFLTTVMMYAYIRPKMQKQAQKGVKNTKLTVRKPNAFQSSKNSSQGSTTGLLHNRVSHKHIFEHRQAIEAYKGQKGAKHRPKNRSKTQNLLFLDRIAYF